MTLKADITAWDMKSRDVINDVYLRHCNDSDFVQVLVNLMQDVALQRAATWLLKHHIEQTRASINPAMVNEIYQNIDKVKHWESRLHILQIMEHLPITTANLKAVEYFVRDCLAADNKFVRAWAFTGFCQIAAQFPAYKTEAKQVLDYALENETAGSVKARVRNELKKWSGA